MAAKTPIQLFTEDYMKIVESEAKSFVNENKKIMLDTASAVLALYLGGSKKRGYEFKFGASGNAFFELFKTRIFKQYEIYIQNAIKLSVFKNQKIFNRLIESPTMDNFLTRKIQNFTLKQRIAKYTQMFKMELEARVANAIVNGEKQDFAIRAIEKYLDRPYDFIDPSERYKYAANRINRKYKPGSGKYVSSFANFKRLGYSEIIEAYRRADHKIWRNQKSVVGQLVYINPAHTVVDSCDNLVGLYPANFLFTGFHGRCVCLNMPIVRGSIIRSVPEGAKNYMKQDGPKKWWGKLAFIQENLSFWN